jgi:hypothetical protein
MQAPFRHVFDSRPTYMQLEQAFYKKFEECLIAIGREKNQTMGLRMDLGWTNSSNANRKGARDRDNPGHE